jgi:hypothetical protein
MGPTRVQTQVILKVSRPEVLEEMRKSKAAKFLGEVLNPTTVIIKGRAIQKVMEPDGIGHCGETQIGESSYPLAVKLKDCFNRRP